VVKDGSCTQEKHDLKPIIAVGKKAAENHAADDESATRTNHAYKQRKAHKSIANICKQGIRYFLLLGRAPFRSKTSSNCTLWSFIFVVSASVLVSLVAFTNLWGYIKF
jgi:hypothetical protein